MEESIKLVCKKCGIYYEKPTIFKKYLNETNHNIFYKWSLEFCDKCRQEKQVESFKALPDVIKILSDNV